MSRSSILNGHFVNLRGEKETDKNYPVEKQYSPEELRRIHNAIRYTHAEFGNSAEAELEESLSSGNQPSRISNISGISNNIGSHRRTGIVGLDGKEITK